MATCISVVSTCVNGPEERADRGYMTTTVAQWHRRAVARINFSPLDRPDLSMALKGRPCCMWKFEFQTLPKRGDIFKNSNWAGCTKPEGERVVGSYDMATISYHSGASPHLRMECHQTLWHRSSVHRSSKLTGGASIRHDIPCILGRRWTRIRIVSRQTWRPL